MSLIDYYNKYTKILTIPHTFNEELEDIPKETEIIIFSNDNAWARRSYFNRSVDKLPKNLTHLTFGWHFNKLVNKLPKNLTHLTFSRNFNQPVDNLPENLTHLTFGEYFNIPVNNLPKNLTHLTFGWDFDKPVDNLPKNLTHLTFGRQTPVRLAHPKIMNIFIIV
jgi:hypothetical protein